MYHQTVVVVTKSEIRCEVISNLEFILEIGAALYAGSTTKKIKCLDLDFVVARIEYEVLT
jgi:hypothetical protein